MKIYFTFILLFSITSIFSQTVIPVISKINDASAWKIYNRAIKTENEKDKSLAVFDARQGDGLTVFQNFEFENGTIEVDIKGKDEMQQSFVGIAFHIQDEKTFNAVYFRPFNFKEPERAKHSVQYICHPEFTWQKLRNEFPEQFENLVNPVPNPDDFFHAKIKVNWPTIQVFVDNSTKPSLEVEMKSTFQKGKVGFWVGNGSDGTFKNLYVTIN